ncbi:helix-turn-helix domain-containing protein [Rathayibacter sp. VKM Ac-2804]|jgi:IclR family acetate operon transcriptional repressor|uniref:IclR family transcriptional regulator n=1 Tax=Rathayibacter sp. VKM Ac-2804 TaxID=2609257 RepID=UPI00132F226B|nr:IclR family transcriptional regulator [Rathayibacter sp. VKM Ac-2804]QHF24549.1 helix-turn-helix domain-containing protein [Rathayibacter sp. VKM Ac-2804]
MTTDDLRSTTLSTLERGLVVLEYLALEGEAPAKRIAADTHLRPGVCYHILRTLVAMDFVSRNEEGLYQLASRSHALGRQLNNHSAVPAELNLILTRLHAQTKETSYVARWADGKVSLQNYLVGQHPVTVDRLEVGYSGDMHARASAKAIIAHLPAEQISALFARRRLTPVTPNTITDFEELRMEFAQIRSQGWAIDREEFRDGVNCVAAAYFDAQGRPGGAFAVSVPLSRFTPHRSRLIEAVVEAASIATRFLETGQLRIGDGADRSSSSTSGPIT